MLESPVLQTAFKERDINTLQGLVIKKIERRFGLAPPDISATLRLVNDVDRLESLLDVAYDSPTLDAFRKHLNTPTAN